MEKQQKEITWKCWACSKPISVMANLDETIDVTCKHCSMSYCGPAQFWSDHRSAGYQLSTPGNKAQNTKFKIIVTE
jgi:hypothetical protein